MHEAYLGTGLANAAAQAQEEMGELNAALGKAGRLAKLVKPTKTAHPDWTHHQIAAHLKCSQGRINEVLSGKRM